MSARHTATPIRRISSGSLAFGARSQSHAATPLSFLQEEALPILADETGALQENLAQLTEIEGALRTFNESFAMFLYGIKMNAFCVEWPEAPSDENLARARRTAMPPPPAAAPVEADDTYHTDPESSFDAPPARPSVAQQARSGARSSTAAGSSRAGRGATPRPTRPERAPAPSLAASSTARPHDSARGRAAPQESTQMRPDAARSLASSRAAPDRASSRGVPKRIPLATKRRREVRPAADHQAFADEVIDTMPLEYRNGDPGQRRLLQSVLLALLSAGEQGVRGRFCVLTTQSTTLRSIPRCPLGKSTRR